MADPIVYSSEQELRENLADTQDLLDHYQQMQEAFDHERWVLTEQVQGALAEHEQRVSDYEQRRDNLDERQAELREQRDECLKNRDALQQQLDAKQDAKLGRPAANAPQEQTQGAQQTEQAKQAREGLGGPVTKADVEQLKSQLARPKATLELKPPGASQASTIDQDLKKMASDIKQKEGRLNDASENLRTDLNRTKGPKP